MIYIYLHNINHFRFWHVYSPIMFCTKEEILFYLTPPPHPNSDPPPQIRVWHILLWLVEYKMNDIVVTLPMRIKSISPFPCPAFSFKMQNLRNVYSKQYWHIFHSSKSTRIKILAIYATWSYEKVLSSLHYIFNSVLKYDDIHDFH